MTEKNDLEKICQFAVQLGMAEKIYECYCPKFCEYKQGFGTSQYCKVELHREREE